MINAFFYSLTVWRRAHLLVLTGSAAALGAAYLSQYGFGLQPCALCLQQRYPYMLVIALSLFSFLLPSPRWQQSLLVLSFLVLLAEAALAFRHVGVERRWWSGPGCSDTVNPGSVDDLRNAILGAPLVRCDTPAFEFAGLSMAGWNSLYALSLAMMLAGVFYRVYKPGPTEGPL